MVVVFCPYNNQQDDVFNSKVYFQLTLQSNDMFIYNVKLKQFN